MTIYYYDLFAGSSGALLAGNLTTSGALWPNSTTYTIAGNPSFKYDGNGMIWNDQTIQGSAAQITNATMPSTYNFEIDFPIKMLTNTGTNAQVGVVFFANSTFNG